MQMEAKLLNKLYRCGLYIGRFQPIHIGHESIIRKMLDECERVIIAIGSAQESGTERNPFSLEHRADLISNVFYRERIEGRLKIMPLEDRENPSNDASWGDYVFQKIYRRFYIFPDVVYEGEEAERNNWYDNRNVEIVRVPRGDIPVSATELRMCIKNREYTEALEMLPSAITYRIDEIRRVIENAREN